MTTVVSPAFEAGFASGRFGRVAISQLDFGYTVRSAGIDAEHVRVLAESEAPMPPIVVHRGTNRIVDGLHRVQAALLRGDTSVEVEYFDGTERDAFVFGLKLNSKHGLPLSKSDRLVAAERMVTLHPDWSDRAVAELVGMAPRTVSGVRKRVGDSLPQFAARLGKDGRVRPLSAAVGREIAGRLFAERPDASLREVAREAGISVGTARDVRNRVSRGEHPVPQRQRVDAVAESAAAARTSIAGDPVGAPPAVQPAEFQQALAVLRRDPSLRLSENGRRILRLLDACAVPDSGWTALLDGVPPHASDVIADLARGCANWWLRIAHELNERDVRRQRLTSVNC